MILGAINRTIRELCSEGGGTGYGKTGWQHLTEEELLYEACVCIFGSQMIYEVAVAAADRIRARGLLIEAMQVGQAPGYKERLVAVAFHPPWKWRSTALSGRCALVSRIAWHLYSCLLSG